MSMCEGNIYCEIYRNKKYCHRTEAASEYRECIGCRHAKRRCEVGNCVFEIDGLCRERAIRDFMIAKRPMEHKPWPKLPEDLGSTGEPPFGPYSALDESTPLTSEQVVYLLEKRGK